MRYYLNLLNIFIIKFIKKYLIKLNDGWIEFIFISINHYVFHLKFLFKFLIDYFADYILVIFFNFLVIF